MRISKEEKTDSTLMDMQKIQGNKNVIYETTKDTKTPQVIFTNVLLPLVRHSLVTVGQWNS